MTAENKGYSIALTQCESKQTAEVIHLKPMALYIPDNAVGVIKRLVNELADAQTNSKGFTLTVTNKNNGVSVDKHFSSLSELEDPMVSADALKDLINIIRGYDTDEDNNVCGW
ncbi:DUF1869 domain-containing protein [Buttiauxella gaviniae]|uniref:DUF1869 domain-containing protein n=1 Tax=Buttiauxella gaviniae TaxID=82990 RepID=A0ABV3P076_9ENTR